MLFEFLKYIQPTNYFALIKKDRFSVFPIPDKLPNKIQSQILLDKGFVSLEAQEYDLSWQAIHKGYIGNGEKLSAFKKLPLKDEYRFIRKYFNPLWATYILLIRTLTFKNPFKELSAWSASKTTKRSDFLKSPIDYKGWTHFESSLITEQKLVTV